MAKSRKLMRATHGPEPAGERGGSGARGRARRGRRSAGAALGADPAEMPLSSPEEELNRSIVKILQEDGRVPFKTIAERLKVSEGTIRNRVAWMKDAGMLQIVAIVDPTSIKYRVDAMLGIKVGSGSTPASVAERLKRRSEVVYIVWVSGRYDLLVELVSDTEEGFQNFILEHCFGQPDVASVEIMTGLATFKNQFLLKNHVAD
jgi:Lrp/AsnC family transcriptional regulator, regulator for asnA, asnC and gidA